MWRVLELNYLNRADGMDGDAHRPAVTDRWWSGTLRLVLMRDLLLSMFGGLAAESQAPDNTLGFSSTNGDAQKCEIGDQWSEQ
jgi:hypothetical protein